MFGRRSYGFGYGFGGGDLMEEVLEVEAVEELAEGDVGGFVADELLADVF